MKEGFSKSLDDAAVVVPIEPERIDFYESLTEKTAKKIGELAERCNMPRAKSISFWVQPRKFSEGTWCRCFYAFVDISFCEQAPFADYAFFIEELAGFLRSKFSRYPDKTILTGAIHPDIYFYKTPSRKRVKAKFIFDATY
jgi:hypothetical protein